MDDPAPWQPVCDSTLPPRAAKPEEETMRREYVAVLDGDGRFPDEIVASCEASSRRRRGEQTRPEAAGSVPLDDTEAGRRPWHSGLSRHRAREVSMSLEELTSGEMPLDAPPRHPRLLPPSAPAGAAARRTRGVDAVRRGPEVQGRVRSGQRGDGLDHARRGCEGDRPISGRQRAGEASESRRKLVGKLSETRPGGPPPPRSVATPCGETRGERR